MTRQVLTHAEVFTGTEYLHDVAVVVEAGRISEVLNDAPGSGGTERSIDISGNRLVPGFFDIQVNGGGGVLLNNDPTVDGIRKIADAHLQFGTTSMLPTLISCTYELMRSAVSSVRQAIENGVPGVVGMHIEGPFLNPVRKGAHDASLFREIDDEAIEILTSLGDAGVMLVTLAPEQTSPERIQELVAAGVVVFAGHTAANYEQCMAAERAGLSGYTHLFNAMTPLASREPGVVGAALDSAESVFGIIADGVHVHPTSFRLACRSKRQGGAILVTDAMPTVGARESSFALDSERIQLVDGVLRNSAGSLAGSNLTMIEAVRNTVSMTGLEWQEAVRMASAYPAKAMRVDHCIGSIAAGNYADMVELDDQMQIVRVWRRGDIQEIHRAGQ